MYCVICEYAWCECSVSLHVLCVCVYMFGKSGWSELYVLCVILCMVRVCVYDVSVCMYECMCVFGARIHPVLLQPCISLGLSPVVPLLQQCPSTSASSVPSGHCQALLSTQIQRTRSLLSGDLALGEHLWHPW